MDLSTLQAAVESLRLDIDMILEDRVPESEAPSTAPTEDTVMAALFATSEISLPPPREHAKRVGVERGMRLDHGIRSDVR